MTAHNDPTGGVAAHATPTCPFGHGRRLPEDGTPLNPSPVLLSWQEEAAITPLTFADGHQGWIATRDGAAQEILSAGTFLRTPQDRFPLSPRHDAPAHLDAQAHHSLEVASILNQDGEHHTRLRRALMKRFSAKAARSHRPAVSAIVASQLDELHAHGGPADLNAVFAQPISARSHRMVLGVPAGYEQDFDRLTLDESSPQAKFDYIRRLLSAKREALREDVLSDLLQSELDPAEVEGLTFVLMTSGRDSVAYMICTSMVALLKNPDQLAKLRNDPSLIDGAVEEFMRFGAMFLTLFPRTASQAVTVEGVDIQAGQTVAVSPVAVNRDPRRFDDPQRFDITRDAFGHLGFGYGIHGCIGQQVARVEIKEAITQLLAAFPTLELVHAEQSEPRPFAHEVGAYEAGAVVITW